MALALVLFTGAAIVVRLRSDARPAGQGKDCAAWEKWRRPRTIYDAHDVPVFTIFKEQRIEVPLEQMSPNLVKAVVSVEDQRFYEHSGVDFIRIAAAGLRNLAEGRRAEGGSTITQQLARQSFLTRDKTYPPQAEGSHPRGAHRARVSPSTKSSSCI